MKDRKQNDYKPINSKDYKLIKISLRKFNSLSEKPHKNSKHTKKKCNTLS